MDGQKRGAMDIKPVTTYAGDVELFATLEGLLSQGLAQETIEWKRSYGRIPRAVTLSATFQPFQAPLSPFKDNEQVPKLRGRQVLHTYWLDCSDLEAYKLSARDAIQTWFSEVRGSENPDWLIILVESADSRKGNKLLPRTTVLDRVKNDFGAKNPERCISVLDPNKVESRTSDSWQTCLFRIRQALLAGLNRAITKFEDNMRTRREHRNDPSWNFADYFLMQEELAFMFEMLGLHDEALVQYDELDALFTQFVLNSTMGEMPKWLSGFQRSPDVWNGVCLTMDSSVNQNLRTKIEDKTTSLIDFRNYLLARQCSLLFTHNKFVEVAQRCLPYLQNCVHELRILGVAMVEGAVSCWVFLSCLEILQACQRQATATSSTQQSDQFALHSAALWGVAKDKLYEVGQLCGLLPDTTIKSEHLHKVVTLSTGMLECPAPDGSQQPSPVDKLKESLSSKEHFKRHYLELSELAMGTYKHVGRLRSARSIGRNLARFYVKLGEPHKAAVFLSDSLKSFAEEKWDALVAATHVDLAEVYNAMQDTERYVKACACIATYSFLGEEKRKHYFDEMILGAKGLKGENLCLPSKSVLKTTSVMVKGETPHKVIVCDSLIELTVTVESHFPRALVCNQVLVSLTPYKSESKKDGAERKISVKHKTVTSTTPLEPAVLPLPNAQAADVEETKFGLFSTKLCMQEQQFYKQDGGLSSVGLACQNVHKLLKRKDSHQTPATDAVVIKHDTSLSFSADNLIINPGSNQITLYLRTGIEGVYLFNQVIFRCLQLEFIGQAPARPFPLTIAKQVATVQLWKGSSDLLAGIPQQIDLVITMGSEPLREASSLRMWASRGLQIKLDANEDPKRELDIHVPAPLKAFESTTIQVRVTADLVQQKDSNTIEHKVTIQAPWAPKLHDIILHFTPPFMAHHKLHTAHLRKYLQVVIHGTTPFERAFCVAKPALTLTDNKIDNLNFVCKNPPRQYFNISQEQSANFLWEIRDQEATFGPVKAEFTMEYKTSDSDKWFPYKHSIDIADYQTLYTIKSKVEPTKGSDFCRSGNMCQMTLTIAPGQATDNNSLMYEVLADQTMWAVCGRTAGVVTMEGSAKHVVSLDVMPLMGGFLPLPAVRLSKYIPADQKVNNRDASRRPEVGLSAPTLPRLEPFGPGQVYNWSKAQQVHVLAAVTGTASSLDTSLS